jgi:hypothetical protein
MNSTAPSTVPGFPEFDSVSVESRRGVMNIVVNMRSGWYIGILILLNFVLNGLKGVAVTNALVKAGWNAQGVSHFAERIENVCHMLELPKLDIDPRSLVREPDFTPGQRVILHESTVYSINRHTHEEQVSTMQGTYVCTPMDVDPRWQIPNPVIIFAFAGTYVVNAESIGIHIR